MKQCTKCGENKDLAEFNKEKKTNDGHRYECRKCGMEASTKRNRANGVLPMGENKECAPYLGVYIAERLIRHLFTDVEVMPNNNKGFDIICNKGMKIDVKSACITLVHKKYPRWKFNIRKNKITDYFLLLAFNDRDDLEPQHQWLIPGHVLNELTDTSISPLTIGKWNEYMQPIGEAVACCNTLKILK